MWGSLVGQQVHRLALFDAPGICILFYTILKLMVLPVEIVLVMDDVVSSFFACGDRIDRRDLPNGFNSIHECGDDQFVSPKEGQ